MDDPLTLLYFFQGWVLTCIFFVFGALLEYSVILLHLKVYSMSLSLPSSTMHMHTSALMSAAASMTGNGSAPQPPPPPQQKNDAMTVYNEKMLRQNRIVSRFDLVCLVAFPIIYVLFVLIYILAVSV